MTKKIERDQCTRCGSVFHTLSHCNWPKQSNEKEKELVYVRCSYCSTLNVEENKYCVKCRRNLDEVK